MPGGDCSDKLRVLANPTRMEVIEALLEQGPLYVWQLLERLQVEPTLLSHHLRALREAGFLEAQRDGKALLYRLAPGIRTRRGRGVDLDCCVLRFPDRRPR